MGKGDRNKVYFIQLFRPIVFDMDFPQFVFGVFELPLLRIAQKRHHFFFKGTYLPHLVAICQIHVGFNKLFGAPWCFFWRLRKFPRFFISRFFTPLVPCYETPKNTTPKKEKRKASGCFLFWGCGKCTSLSSSFSYLG
jgi:hypothetical protein